MASQKTKFAVGLFLTIGIGIAVIAFIWLGMSRFLEKGQLYVTYFNESVQGLDVDSAVKYRGVSIGRVQSIGVAPDSKLIQVVLKIETGQKLTKDLVAQLKSVGITGTMFVELDQKIEGEPDQSPKINFPSEYPIVPSKPSNISEIMQGIDDALNQIKSMDLEGISTKIKRTLDNMNQVMADADVKGISSHMQSSLEEIRAILDVERWNRIMAGVEEATQSLNSIMHKANAGVGHAETSLAKIDMIINEKGQVIQRAIDELESAMKKTNLFLEKGTSLVDRTDDSVYRLSRYLSNIAENLEQASENISRLTERVADQPSQLIFGEPPAPRKPE